MQPNLAPSPTPIPKLMRVASGGKPEPLFAAALYCAGGLDDVIQHALVPFFREALALDEAATCWFFRYGRGGEHLKVRVGGSEERHEALRLLFASVVDRAWPLIPRAKADGEERWTKSPVIGPEDEERTEPRDRCLVWCEHGRTPWIFGVGSLKDSDDYVASATSCLTAGCHRLLPLFAGDGPSADGTDQRRLMLTMIVEAVAATEWPLETALRYLAYHRDAIIRFLLIPNEEPEQRAAALLERFSSHAAKIADTASDSPGRHGAYLPQALAALEPNRVETEWHRAVGGLIRLLQSVPAASRQDPFARNPEFTPLFKVLHTLANALGIGLFNECFLYHLLLSGSEQAENEVVLEPTWDWATP